MTTPAQWPEDGPARTRLIVSARPVLPRPDPWRLQGCRIDAEVSSTGRSVTVGTVFLTGRECAWSCAMCDLWQYTTHTDTPKGAIPAQIADACRSWAEHGVLPEQVKLYNASSFFDARAVPPDDYAEIATALHPFERVIVESHPALVGPRVDAFQSLLHGALEVAMGLETAHPEALERLNKRMDVALFTKAATYLSARGIAVRTFLLMHPPFVPAGEQHTWLRHSLDAAIAAGSTTVVLIPTRPGNGIMEHLQATGLFTPASKEESEEIAALALAHAGDRIRVLVDPWDGTGVS